VTEKAGNRANYWRDREREREREIERVSERQSICGEGDSASTKIKTFAKTHNGNVI
jgi:hypothetical protein